MDSIFHLWDPWCDAKEFIKYLHYNTQESVLVEELDKYLQWGPRRMNSAIALLYLHELICDNYELGGIDYVLRWITLTEEAYFAS